MKDEPERRLEEGSNRLAIAVTVRDISIAGVRLQVDAGAHLPAEFDPLAQVVGDVEQRHRVWVAWREGDELGGEFAWVEATESTNESDQQPRQDG